MALLKSAGKKPITVYVLSRSVYPSWEATITYDSETSMWKGMRFLMNHNNLGRRLDVKYDGDWWHVEKNGDGKFTVIHGVSRYDMSPLGTLKWDVTSSRDKGRMTEKDLKRERKATRKAHKFSRW